MFDSANEELMMPVEKTALDRENMEADAMLAFDPDYSHIPGGVWLTFGVLAMIVAIIAFA